jgi:putative ABC transport system permease protein
MNDLRDALRALKATPIVSVIAVLSLALGIGANTAIFSIVNSLMLRSLPVKEPDRLAVLGQGRDRDAWTNPIWEEVRKRQGLLGGAMAWSAGRINTARAGETQFVDGVWASREYFDVLGVPAVLGRTFTEADDRRGGGPDGPVTVISYDFWQRRFGGAADVIGKSIPLERIPFTIIGVTPPEFFGAEVGNTFDVVIPIGAETIIRGNESALDKRSWWWLSVMVRLKPGQTLDAAAAALRGVQPQIREATLPENWRPEDLKEYLSEPFTLIPAGRGPSYLRSRYQRPLLTIMVVVALVLLIACANIANLLLARATARRHELSVRLALGASRGRLARQLISESLLLSGIGAALGLLLARWGGGLLVRQISTETSTVFLNLSLDWHVMAFTAAVAIGTALLFGTTPALRATRVQPNEALKEQGRGVAGDRRVGLGAMLVVVQVALSVMLVVAAGLFMQTFSRLARLNLGFDRSRLLVVNADVQRSSAAPANRAALFERLRQAAAAVPGVQSAALSVVTPVSGSTWQYRIEIPEKPDLPEKERGVYVNVVAPDFFRTFGTRILAGRDASASDKAGTPAVAIVNQTFANKFFDGAHPLGRRVRIPGRPDRPTVNLEVIGLVEDAVYRSLRSPVPPTMYLPLAQQTDSGPPMWGMSISVRAASGSPALLTRSVAAALTAVDRDVALTFRPLAEQVSNSLIQERVIAMMSGFFGGLALLLAALGLYGVTSYAVSRRRTEIGIRMALGAAPGGVIRLVLRRVGLMVGLGVILGSAVSLWASKFVSALLFGMQPRDPATLVAAALVLASVGGIAGWLPARRAARIDPARVLREG